MKNAIIFEVDQNFVSLKFHKTFRGLLPIFLIVEKVREAKTIQTVRCDMTFYFAVFNAYPAKFDVSESVTNQKFMRIIETFLKSLFSIFFEGYLNIDAYWKRYECQEILKEKIEVKVSKILYIFILFIII